MDAYRDTMDLDARLSADSAVVDRQKNRRKSKQANGTALLPGVDGRSAWVRRAKELIADHLSDLGGEVNTSAAERSLIRRAATMTVELERYEKRFALAGEASPEDLDLYSRIAANLRRLLESVGLQRRARAVGPSLGDLLRGDLIENDARHD
jgi:hypothetical protein